MGARSSEELSRSEWAAIPAPAVALPAPGATQASPEEAAKALKAMGADAILNDSGRDPRRWARRILAEAQRKGGRVPSLAVLNMAQAAVGAPTDSGGAV